MKKRFKRLGAMLLAGTMLLGACNLLEYLTQ